MNALTFGLAAKVRQICRRDRRGLAPVGVLMRLSSFAALSGALMLFISAGASAASVTYTIKGTLSAYSSFGTDAVAIAAALGRPSSFEINFTLPTLAAGGKIPCCDGYYFAQTSATLKLDGVTRLSTGVNPSGINLSSTNGIQSLSFGMGGSGDLAPAVPGTENMGGLFSLYFPLNTFDEKVLPSAGNILALTTGSNVSINISNLPAGSQFASLAEASNPLGTMAITAFSITPAPEPGEWAMIAGGLGVVGAAARRRRKS